MNIDALRLLLFTSSSSISKLRLTPLLTHNPNRCPPCKGFSPMLLDFYNTCKDDLEIVFVSSDRDDKSFNDYYQKLMPFSALVPAFTNENARKVHVKLADMFKIQGIPSLIVLDAKTGHFM
jgi:nucleoredoxin